MDVAQIKPFAFHTVARALLLNGSDAGEISAIKVRNNVLMRLLLDVLQPVDEPVALKAIFFYASTDSAHV